MGRRLGQHFLRPASVDRLVRVIDPRPDQEFLEIGAGRGALTLPLARLARRVVAIELDPPLARELAATAPPNVEVVQGDALSLDLASLLPPAGRLAGNLPYAISSPLLRRFLDLRDRLTDMHLMVQREVAERIASGPGSKAYGIHSVLYAVWTDVGIALRFGPGCFDPPPRVDSAVLHIRPLAEPRVPIDDLAAFESLVRRSFAHRRKTLENNLQFSYHNHKQHLRLLNILGSRRAETLSIVEFARLSQALAGDVVVDV
jgi:16S rRNA (adenine1518-N6/adenine1519-N6)-dimethyltransferase